jgi:hypothetical protein
MNFTPAAGEGWSGIKRHLEGLEGINLDEPL